MHARLLAPALSSFALIAFSAPLEGQALGEVLSAVTYAEGQGGFSGVLGDGDRFGAGLARIGDVDGDGVEDVAIGAPGADGGGVDRGALWLLFLNADGTARDSVRIDDATPALAGLLPDLAAFGSDVGALGDVNGDGVPDVAVGAPSVGDATRTGEVHVLFLDAAGAVTGNVRIGDGLGGFVLPLDTADSFGQNVEGLGDLDGNGVGDLAVGKTDQGTFFTLRLLADGTVKGAWELGNGLGGVPNTTNTLFGSGLGLLGDVNGDGVPDLAVGESDDVSPAFPSTGSSTWILFLATNGTAIGATETKGSDDVFENGEPVASGIGADASGVGDIDGDGVADVVYGSPFFDDSNPPIGQNNRRGGVWIGLANGDGTLRKTVRISDTRGGLPFALEDEDQLGIAVEDMGDFDGDGVHDLLVGRHRADEGGTDRGAAHLLFLRGNEYPASATERFGLGVNDPCYSNVSLPSIGLLWTSTYDGGAYYPDVVLSGIAVYSAPLVPGVLAGTEEVLVDVLNGAPVIGSYGTGDAGTVGYGIPYAPGILGLEWSAQAFLIRSGGRIELCNAIDLVIGN